MSPLAAAGVPWSAVPFAARGSDEIVIGPWLLSWAGAFEWRFLLVLCFGRVPLTGALERCSQLVLSIGTLDCQLAGRLLSLLANWCIVVVFIGPAAERYGMG